MLRTRVMGSPDFQTTFHDDGNDVGEDYGVENQGNGNFTVDHNDHHFGGGHTIEHEHNEEGRTGYEGWTDSNTGHGNDDRHEDYVDYDNGFGYEDNTGYEDTHDDLDCDSGCGYDDYY